ncbi:MAG: hypothetical protein NTZ78_13460 [Candidatus Aureabacteria bacterium]|nr:hypothetical protein [Candidatus Auribacterota bacterium]
MIRIKMFRFYLLVALASVTPTCLYAGTPHIITGSLYNSDHSIPSDGEIHFTAFVQVRPGEILTEASGGCGYEGGSWWVEAGNFTTTWTVGEMLVVGFINITTSATGILTYSITNTDPDPAPAFYLSPPPPATPSPTITPTRTPTVTPTPTGTYYAKGQADFYVDDQCEPPSEVDDNLGNRLEVGDLLQVIYSNGEIDPPNPANPDYIGGDDELFGNYAVGVDEQGWLNVGAGEFTFAMLGRALAEVYIRAWDAGTISASNYYGETGVYELDPPPSAPPDYYLSSFSTNNSKPVVLSTPTNTPTLTPTRTPTSTPTVTPTSIVPRTTVMWYGSYCTDEILSPLQDGDLIQLIRSPDDTITAPDSNGMPTGNALLANTTTYHFPGEPEIGDYFWGDYWYEEENYYVWVRIWNDSDPGAATCYWDSPIYPATGLEPIDIDCSGASTNICEPTPTPTVTPTPTPVPPVITNITRSNSSSPVGNITITWNSQAGAAYDVYYATTLTGTYTDIADVTATATSTVWIDDGSQTGSHPASVDQRYYKLACYGTSLYSSDTVGEYKVTMYSSGSANSLTSVSLPFVQYATGMNAVFGGQGHTGTPAIPALSDKLNKFDPTTEDFTIRFWKSASGWVALGNTEPVTLQADEGFLYTNSLATPQNIWFVGKVAPANRSLPIRGASGKAQLTYVGSGYPVPVSLGNSNLIGSGFHGSTITGLSDLIYEFNLSTGEFDHIAWYKTTTSLWMFINPGTSFGLEPGKAYIITNRDNSAPPEWTWDYAKPYSQPPN